MKNIKKYIIQIMILLVTLVGVSPACADWEHMPGQLTVDILQIPTPLFAADKYYLVYELHLTNYHGSPITLKSLDVQDANKNWSGINYTEQKLADLIHSIGSEESKLNPVILQPGQTKMVFMWLAFPDKAAIPNQLAHKIVFNTQRKNEKLTLTTYTNPLIIAKTSPVIVSPPLRGDYWVAGNGPSNTSGHRNANLVVNGHDYFAQRYAIDFIQIGKDGTAYHGDKSKNENYYCYGKDVLAVAEGQVIEIKDGIVENIPDSGKFAVPMDIDTLGGNHVVIDIGKGHYAFFAHLIPGSIKVKNGDKVLRGQVIGKVGNSGNSTSPHLHFHIVDKPSFIGANGIPYAFDRFSVRHSQLISDDPNFKTRILDSKLEPKSDQLMLENTVVKF